ncbi:helix-turn-helix domain-containing protein [Actinoplanes italicus]|uniref:helix-turn-helix domain-containing protein n=1 Tax=Actinoplanes italicus TaxID=113567 RepID=UPI0014756465|nr:helix-turn-helix domain-containing protein [Actinoplanes italicus]
MSSSVIRARRRAEVEDGEARLADHADRPEGTTPGAILGTLTAVRLSGDTQILRRTPRAGRRSRDGRLKLCMQFGGVAIVSQDGHRARIESGRMALYDPGRPYDLYLEGRWSCIVLTFPRSALSLPDGVVRQAMLRPHPFGEGPGAVLADFVVATLENRTSIGTSAGRLGEAAFHLIAGALDRTEPADAEAAADTLRRGILRFAREHLSDPALTHDEIAAAHLMAPRSLHRLFEQEPHTVTEYIRLRRLESAHRDLTDPLLGHLSIARIAARWCFPSQAHFTRAFQARYGTSPSIVRRASARSSST